MYLCLYHKNCSDGLGAALAVWLYMKEKGLEVEFQPIQYGDPVPDVVGKDIFVVDFSFPREQLLEMNKQAKSLVVIDHHKTAEAELADLDFCIFDLDKSGCVLTWEYLFPDKPIPDLFLHLQDRDLWQWKLPYSREVSAALRSYKPFFEIWNGFLHPTGIQILRTEGLAILRYQQREIEAALSRPVELVEIGGYQVPCINSTHLISELGNEMAKGHPFAALYFDTTDGKRVFSLRSTDEGIDVSEIAKKYGGGGHMRASGFSVSIDKECFRRMIDNVKR